MYAVEKMVAAELYSPTEFSTGKSLSKQQINKAIPSVYIKSNASSIKFDKLFDHIPKLRFINNKVTLCYVKNKGNTPALKIC